jgi:hypothetical protein
MAAESVLQLHENGSNSSVPTLGFAISNLTVLRPLALGDSNSSGVELLLSLHRLEVNNLHSSDEWYKFSITSCTLDGENWQEHCVGSVKLLLAANAYKTKGNKETCYPNCAIIMESC